MNRIEVPDPVTGFCTTFMVDSGMSQKRAETMYTKEPITIDWLRTMGKGDRFLDIGANVGCYTLFASVVMGMPVIAFEPESQNFARLCMNIHANGVGDLVTPYPFAASSGPADVGMMVCGSMQAGKSGHQVEHANEVPEPEYEHGVFFTDIDQMQIAATHIKIDTDGNEHAILAGMEWTLKEARTILVEDDGSWPLSQYMTDRGWKLERAAKTGTKGFENRIYSR